MATKKPEKDPKQTKPETQEPIKTQMKGGESGDDDLGYDPSTIPTETIDDD